MGTAATAGLVPRLLLVLKLCGELVTPYAAYVGRGADNKKGRTYSPEMGNDVFQHEDKLLSTSGMVTPY